MLRKNVIFLCLIAWLMAGCSVIDTGKDPRKEIGFPAGHEHQGM